jgi:uncharacterized membrane protein
MHTITESKVIDHDVHTVYNQWTQFEDFPRFMEGVERVEQLDDRHLHWVADFGGSTHEWDAEITEQVPDERIAWRSTGDASVPNQGAVQFTGTPRGDGTEVRVELEYHVAGGKLAQLAARLFGEEPEQQVRDDLRRFKQVMETGEVVRSEASPGGLEARRQLAQHPARPPA